MALTELAIGGFDDMEGLAVLFLSRAADAKTIVNRDQQGGVEDGGHGHCWRTYKLVENNNNTSLITLLPSDIFNSHVLPRLDGPTLTSAAFSSSELHTLCTRNHLWQKICSATWPSLNHPLTASLISTFPAGHFSIFSHSFPSPSINHNRPIPTSSLPPPPELISAVDLYYQGKPFFSKVHVTVTRKTWFLSTPLWLDILEPNEVVPTDLKFPGNDDVELLKHLEENLTLSWIMIDPSSKRAVNLSGRSVVSTRWQSLTEELEVVYAVMVEEEVQCGIKVTCCGKVGGAMHVREISLTMEDMDGRHVMGKESMVILQRAMESVKRKRVGGIIEAKESYEKFCERKRERRERLIKRHKTLDRVADSMLVVFTIVALLAWFRMS
ncbi:hypothetical protein RIF29_27497 [Crotalaria pallida]|uniref:F-box domain-containing protein n=1 Tax=Crotalaria pallida TaxID=3830 RepID=A0AAN9EPP4_CROPI